MTDPLEPIIAALSDVKKRQGGRSLRLATVTSANTTGVKVRFDSDSTASVRYYKSICNCRVGDRVVMAQIGGSWVVLGTINENNPNWIAPTLLNNWVNYGLDGWEEAGYKKVGGITYMKGLIKNGTIRADILVLPVGYRPISNMHIVVPANSAYGCINVYSDGRVFHNAGANNWMSLVCSFPADG